MLHGNALTGMKTRLQKVLFAVAGVRRQVTEISKNKWLQNWFVPEFFIPRLFAGASMNINVLWNRYVCD